MIKSVSALLFGASLLAAVPASAADFYKYTFNVVGTGSVSLVAGSNPSISRTDVPTSGVIEFYSLTLLPASGGSYSAPYFGNRNASYLASDGGLTAYGNNQSRETYGGMPYNTDSASVTIESGFPNGFPGLGTYAVTGASSARYQFENIAPSYGNSGTFTGTVTALTISEGFGQPFALGLVTGTVAAIPEPATWAMMVLGFAAVGFAARRRRSIEVAC